MDHEISQTECGTDALRAEFRERFGGAAKIFRAPGRVNLIGEHTDYNEGFVFPAAIGYDTCVACSENRSGQLVIHSKQESSTATFVAGERDPRHNWTDYVRGVQLQLQAENCSVTGANLLIDGHVPIGAGLSSSAAIETATALALLDLAGCSLDRISIARLCQRAENEFVGARCGIMDQTASLNGRAGHAMVLDCRSLELRYVRIPDTVSLVVCNTMVKHSLAGGEYNARRTECEEGVRYFAKLRPGITALRDVTEGDLLQFGEGLPQRLLRRCRHVITENARVLRAADALAANELEVCGQLMYESHDSLKNDYEVSCPELDVMVELAKNTPGTYGARMTGGGFGGCTINLVARDAVPQFIRVVAAGYRDKIGITPEIYVTEAVDGAGPAS